MKGIRALLAAAGVGIIGYAVYRYYKRQTQFLQQYEYKVIGLRLVTFRKDLMSFDINTRLLNNSNVDATIKEIYLDMFINGVQVGNIDEVKDTYVRANGFSDLSFRISFNPQVILGNLLNLLTLSVAWKDVIISLDGYVKVKSAFVQANIPFTYQNNLKELLKK